MVVLIPATGKFRYSPMKDDTMKDVYYVTYELVTNILYLTSGTHSSVFSGCFVVFV